MSLTDIDMAVVALAEVDAIFKRHIKTVGACPLRPRMNGRSHFEQLACSIAYQQLAGKAAEAIWKRVRALIQGPFIAESVLLLGHSELRGAGLSENKALSLRDLAERVADGRLSLRRLASSPDEEVIEALTKVRGIGRWTAEMFLIFQLGRLDVWPVGDYGVRNGYRLLYQLDDIPKSKELSQYGFKFAPYRSVAAWYCWRAVDVALPS